MRLYRGAGPTPTFRAAMLTVTCVALLLCPVCASAPQGANRFSRALPTAEDLPGFGGFHVSTRGSRQGANLTARRTADGLQLVVGLLYAPSEADASMWPTDPANRPQSAAGTLTQVASHPAVNAQQVWATHQPRAKTLHVAAIDGRCVVEVLVTPRADLGTKGAVQRRQRTEADITFANKILSEIMERLTALGLTSRDPATASAAALRRVGKKVPSK